MLMVHGVLIPALKSERSLNHTLFAQAKNNIGVFDINLYQISLSSFLI